MKIIADSGSTKTDWRLMASGGRTLDIVTRGINPAVQTESYVGETIGSELAARLVSTGWLVRGEDGALTSADSTLLYIYYYGAGCIEPFSTVVAEALRQTFGTEAHIEVASDLLGAARALCQHGEGVACILGTGSNSCLYDGRTIVANTPPLGYILGDEGSGAVLGRNFYNLLLKGHLPQRVADDFFDRTNLTRADIIREVYRGQAPNRYLASVSPFIAEYIAVPQLRDMVTDSFRRFFRMNVAPYGRNDLSVNAVGSIAHAYRALLDEAARAEGFCLGHVEQKPLDGLTAYHQN